MTTPMEKAPDPQLGWELVPKERYTSRDFAELEWRHMWRRVWLLAGSASDIPEPGDYFTFDIGPESILVIRQATGAIAARHPDPGGSRRTSHTGALTGSGGPDGADAGPRRQASAVTPSHEQAISSIGPRGAPAERRFDGILVARIRRRW